MAKRKNLAMLMLMMFAAAMPRSVILGQEKLELENLMWTRNFKNYQLRLYEASGYQRVLQILRGAKDWPFVPYEEEVIRIKDLSITVVASQGSASQPGDFEEIDLTGNGRSNLVIHGYSGGAHCCSTFYLLELDEEFHLVQEIATGHADSSPFVDINGDGAVEVSQYDHWAYWRGYSFAESPGSRLVYRFDDNNDLQLAADLMRKPPPTLQELAAEASELEGHHRWEFIDFPLPPAELVGRMLDLIYSGNSDSAWKLLHLSWPAHAKFKDQFLTAFKARLDLTVAKLMNPTDPELLK